MKTDLADVFRHFRSEGTFLKGEAFGSGHIHDTYKITTAEEESPNYILQRINTNIFRDVEELQNNIFQVTSHIRRKLSAIPGTDPDRETLTIIPATDGKLYHCDDLEDFWRAYLFIERHRSYDKVETTEQAYQGGRAIGRFETLIAGLDPARIYEVLPGFHDMELRLENFYRVLEKDPEKRVSVIREDIQFVLDRAEEMMTIQRLGKEGKIPLRITHNDTKFNNVLLDERDKSLCVIDLDTVMPGYIHYDFGDAIRTSANSTFEDEKDLEKVFVRLDFFEAFTKGFLEETRNELTSVEKNYLVFSTRMMTFIIGLRFLTDYLDGDHYFKIHHPGHNLERARVQFRLVKSMEDHRQAMEKIVEKFK
ncbi:MAG: aminoglycoside phosphotransferase family protein [Bacteroidales bacterium]|nr:aminoglycoside phosphotransferase family protein [Bacteroidales bacterium]